MDGPRVHFMTVLRVTGAPGQDAVLQIPPALAAEAGAPYLARARRLGELVQAQTGRKVPWTPWRKRSEPLRTMDMERLEPPRSAR